jgi:hypothetical protein
MIYASVIGIGKYIGSYWLNLRSYLQINNKEVNPAFTATRDIILTIRLCYSVDWLRIPPDERVSLDLEQRISLNPIESVQAILNSLEINLLQELKL